MNLFRESNRCHFGLSANSSSQPLLALSLLLALSQLLALSELVLVSWTNRQRHSVGVAG